MQIPLAERLERGQGEIVVILFGGAGSGGKDCIALLGWQSPQLVSCPAPTRVHRRS
jgi:hypothetical protein